MAIILYREVPVRVGFRKICFGLLAIFTVSIVMGCSGTTNSESDKNSNNAVDVDDKPSGGTDDKPSGEGQETNILYNITASEIEHGEIFLYKRSARTGDIVTFSVYVEDAYIIDSVYAGSELLGNSVGDYSFTMPKGDVEISVNVIKNSGNLGIIIY